MKKHKVRILLICLVVLIVSVPVFFTGRLFIFSRLQKNILAQLESLRKAGVIVHYKSLEIDSWKKSLVINGLELKFSLRDSICPTAVTMPRLEAAGIALLPLLFKHELDLDGIILDRPAVRVMNNFKMPGRKKLKENFLKHIQIGLVKIDSGAIELIDSTSCANVAYLHLNLNSRDLSAQLNADSTTWAVAEVTIADVVAAFPAIFYKLNIKKAFYSDLEKIIKADSVQITPLYGRADFAKRAGRQIDQFNCLIPAIQASGFEMKKSTPHTAGSYLAHRVDLRFRLDVFRDKRVPRKPRRPTVLPVLFLHQLPFRLQIDTLAIADSYVLYEEFPKTGDATGKLFFNELHAGISNISNISLQGATMNVTTRFMNAGDLKATFTFPFEAEKPYTAKGSLSNFSIPAINAMLVPFAHAEIESGEMQEMKFHFQYNEYRSDGEVELSYTNLKVRRFKRNQEQLENKLVSFFLNLFVKNNMDKSDTREKRTGTVQMVRNDQRGIFNYWCKSVFSGVRSQFRLDKKGTSDKKKSHSKS